MHRTSTSLLHRVFREGFTLVQLYSKRPGVSLPAYRYRFRQALRRYVARSSPQKIPPGPLVLLADGLWFEFDGMPWVLYLTALKPCRANYATFLDPLLLPGKEGASRWQQALAAIPPDATCRIQAVIVDNLPGMRRLAYERQWVLQLCHFHLLLKLQAQRRGVRYALRGGPVREEIHQFVRRALQLPDGKSLTRSLEHLGHLSQGDCGTQNIQNDSSRVPEKSAVLPLLPFASAPRSAMDHQLCRIHGSPYPRTVPQQPRRLKPSLRAALGDCAHSHAPDRELQRSFVQQKILTHPQFVTLDRVVTDGPAVAGPVRD